MQTIVIAGAGGFVGRFLVPALDAAGHEVRCGSRSPHTAARRAPQQRWVELDLDRIEPDAAALQGASVCVVLARVPVASMTAFAQRAQAAGVQHLVVLTALEPSETEPLLHTGLPCTVLRAAAVVGEGSECWTICRDLGMRAPVMVQPAWFGKPLQPLWIGDLLTALVHAIEHREPGQFDLPGPEVLTTADLVAQITSLRHMRPRTLPVPANLARFSSLWLRMFTRADRSTAERVVGQAMHNALLDEPGYWALLPEHHRVDFQTAARRMLRYEKKPARIPERLLESLTRRAAGAGMKRTEPEPH